MLKWIKEHKIEVVVILLGILIVFLVVIAGLGWDCMLHNTNCPPPTNVTDLTV